MIPSEKYNREAKDATASLFILVFMCTKTAHNKTGAGTLRDRVDFKTVFNGSVLDA